MDWIFFNILTGKKAVTVACLESHRKIYRLYVLRTFVVIGNKLENYTPISKCLALTPSSHILTT